MDQLFNLEFQVQSVFNLEFQPKFGIQPVPMGINLEGWDGQKVQQGAERKNIVGC